VAVKSIPKVLKDPSASERKKAEQIPYLKREVRPSIITCRTLPPSCCPSPPRLLIATAPITRTAPCVSLPGGGPAGAERHAQCGQPGGGI
jgi:hypothetical protein